MELVGIFFGPGELPADLLKKSWSHLFFFFLWPRGVQSPEVRRFSSSDCYAMILFFLLFNPSFFVGAPCTRVHNLLLLCETIVRYLSSANGLLNTTAIK